MDESLIMDAATSAHYQYDLAGQHYKIVYFGPPQAGKLSNLVALRAASGRSRIALTSMRSEWEGRLFWDGLAEVVAGTPVRYHLYTISGPVLFPSAYVRLLMGVDGLVFVADSAPDKQAQNQQMAHLLAQILPAVRRSLATLPVVLQYNKRDLARIVPTAHLQATLNSYGWPAIESCASAGQGVMDTFLALRHQLLRSGAGLRPESSDNVGSEYDG